MAESYNYNREIQRDEFSQLANSIKSRITITIENGDENYKNYTLRAEPFLYNFEDNREY